MTPRVPAVAVRFDDARLRMSVAGRMIVRVSTYVTYFLSIAAAATFLASDIPGLRGAGAFLALFLLDRLFHLREGDRPLSELPDRGTANLAHHLSPRAFHMIERAYDHATITGRPFALAMAREFMNAPETGDALRRLDVPERDFRSRLEGFIKESAVGPRGTRRGSAEQRRASAEALVVAAFPHAIAHGHRFIEAHDILTSLPDFPDETLARLFAVFEISSSDLFRAFIFPAMKREFGGIRRLPASLSGMAFGAAREARRRVMKRAWMSRPTPTLDAYADDFTDLARREAIGFLVGQEEEYARLLEVLSRPANPNALLVGEPGVGKEAIVAHLAFEIGKDRVPPALFDKRLVAFRIPALVAGASDEELTRRITRIVEEILASGNIVLYVPEAHDLARTAGAGSLTLADALIPVFRHNAFPVIGATTPREYAAHVAPRRDVAEICEVIRVGDLSADEAETLLSYSAVILESRNGMYVSFGAVREAVRFASRSAPREPLVASAERVLVRAIAAAKECEESAVRGESVLRLVE